MTLGARLPWLWMRRPERLLLTALAMLLADVSIPGAGSTAPLTASLIGGLALLSFAGAASALMAARRALDPGTSP